MNIKLYTAAREATSKARNVASAIQQAQRQVNDDNKDIKDKVDKNQQNRAKNKAKEELESAKVAKDLAAKQLSISQQQATAGAIQALGAVALSVVGAQVDKKKKENDPKEPVKDDGQTQQQISGNQSDDGEKAKGGGILGKIKDAIKSVFGGGGEAPAVGDGGGDGGKGKGDPLGGKGKGGLGDGGGGGGLGLGDGAGGGDGGPGLGDKLKKLGGEFLDMGNSDEKYAGVEGKGNKDIAKGVEGGLKLLQMGGNPMQAANKLAGMADQGLRGLESKMGLGAFAEKNDKGEMVRTQAGESFANIMDTIGKLLGAKEIDSKLAQIGDKLKEVGNMFDNPNELGMLGKAVKAGVVDTFKATTQLAGAALTDVANAGTQAVQGGVDSAFGRNGGDNGATEQTKQNETDRAKSLVDNAGTTTPGTPSRGDGAPATPATTTLSAEQEQQLAKDLRQLFSAGTEEGGRARSSQEIDALVGKGLDAARLRSLSSQLGPDFDIKVEGGQVSVNGAKLDAGIAERLLAGDQQAIGQVSAAAKTLTAQNPGNGQVIGNNGQLRAVPNAPNQEAIQSLIQQQGVSLQNDGSGISQSGQAVSRETLQSFQALQTAGIANVAINSDGKLTLGGQVINTDQTQVLQALQARGVDLTKPGAVTINQGKIQSAQLGSDSGSSPVNVDANTLKAFGQLQAAGIGNVALTDDGKLTLNGQTLAADQAQTLTQLQALGVNVSKEGNIQLDANGKITGAKLGVNGSSSVIGIDDLQNALAVAGKLSSDPNGVPQLKIAQNGSLSLQLANGATIDNGSLALIAKGLGTTATLEQSGAAKALLSVAQARNGLSIQGASLASNGDLSVNGITVGANAVQVLAGNTARSGQDVTGGTVNRDVSSADQQLLIEAVRAGSFLSAAANNAQAAGIKVDLGGLNSDNSRVSLTAGGKSVSQSDLRALSSGNASLATYQDILGTNTSAAGAVRGLLQSLGASDVKIGSGTGANFTASDSGDKINFTLNGRESTIQLNEIDLGATDGGRARQFTNNQAFGAIRAVAQLANNGLNLSSVTKDGQTAPAVTINREGTVNINAGGKPQRTLDATSISRINGDTSGGVASSVATSIATGGQIEGNRSAGSFSNTRQALTNFGDVFGRIGSGVSGVFGPGKGNDSSNIPDSLKEGAVRDIGNVIDNATKGKSGLEARNAAAEALKGLGFTEQQINEIIPAKKNDKNEVTGFSFSKSALSDNLSVSRASDGANGFTFSVSAAGNTSKTLGGLNVAANGTITAQGGSITTGRGTPQEAVTDNNFGLDFSGLAKNANNNRRDTIAQNLNNLLAEKGFGRSVVFADQIQLDAQGNLAGVRVAGKNLSVEQFAAQAFANRSGNARIGSAEQLATELRNQAGVALQRSSGALQNGGGGSDIANAATTALNNLRASGFNVEGATINFDAGNGKAQINLKDGKSLFVDSKGNFSDSAGATGSAAGNATLLQNTFGVAATGPELTKFNRNQDQIQRLTSAIEEGFQAKAFGLFGVTNSKVNNLQVGFDANGNINSARATLANGSEVAFNRINFETGVFSIDKAASKGSEMLADPENTYLNSASDRTLQALRRDNSKGALTDVLGSDVVRDQKGYSGNNLQVDKNDYNNSTQERDYTGLNVAGRDIRLRSDYDATGRGTTSTSDLSQAERALLSNQILSQQQLETIPATGNKPEQKGLIDKTTDARINDLLTSLQGNAVFKQAVATGNTALRDQILTEQLAKQGIKPGSVTAANLTIAGTGNGETFSVEEAAGLREAVRDQVDKDVKALKLRAEKINENASQLGKELVETIANDDQLKAAIANGDTSGAKVRLEQILESKGLSKDAVRLRDITTVNPNTDQLELKDSAGITSAALGSGALNSRQLGIQTALLAKAQVAYDRTNNGGSTPEGVGTASAGVAQLERSLLGQLNSRLGGGEQPVVQRGDQLTAERNVVESIRAAYIARGGQLDKFDFKFATTQLQDLLNDPTFRAQATSSDSTQRAAAQEKLKQANLNAGLAENAIEMKDLGIDSKGLGTLLTAEQAKEKLGSVNVTAGYDGRDARIDVRGVTFNNNQGDSRKADFSITRNQRGGYSVNLNVGKDDAFGKEIKDQLGDRFSSDEGKEGWVSKVTKGLATGLNAAMPGIEYWRKGLEAIQEALIQLEAAKKQLAAAMDYFAKMGLTPGMIVAGGDGSAPAPAGGPGGPGGPGPVTGGGGGNLPPGGGPGPVTGGGSGGGSNGPGSVDNGGGGDSSGGNGPGPVGEGDGSVDGANMDANGDGVVSEGEQMVGNSASSSAFENLAVNLGYMPGMLIQMAQEQGKLDELGELLVQLSQPDKINPIVAMIQFTQKLMSDPNQLADAGAAALGG